MKYETLYVSRPVDNYFSIYQIGQKLGLPALVVDPHVTICYSRHPVKKTLPLKNKIVLTNENIKSLTKFNDCVVLLTTQEDVENRFYTFLKLGAKSDYPSYNMHITLFKDEDNKITPEKLEQLNKKLKDYLNKNEIKITLGYEVFAKLDDDYQTEQVKVKKIENDIKNILSEVSTKSAFRDAASKKQKIKFNSIYNMIKTKVQKEN